MRLGIIGAMEVEVALLKEHMENPRIERVAGLEFYGGSISGAEVAVVRSGVGKVFAAMCTQALIDRFHPDAILNTGIAGSLDERIDIGDFVVSTDCVQHDYDVTSAGYEPGRNPALPGLGLWADGTLRATAVEAVHRVAPSAQVFEGRIASGDQFIADAARKDLIAGQFGALCCEMESAAIAQVAWANGIPYVVVRAISDTADQAAEEVYPEFEEVTARRCAEVVLELARLL